MEILVKIIARGPIMDLSNEVKYFCIGSLTKLMEGPLFLPFKDVARGRRS